VRAPHHARRHRRRPCFTRPDFSSTHPVRAHRRPAEVPAVPGLGVCSRGYHRLALPGRLTRAPDSGRPQTGRSSPRQARRRAAGPVAAPLCGYQAGQKRGLNFLARPLAATKYLTQLLCQTQRTHGERIYPSQGCLISSLSRRSARVGESAPVPAEVSSMTALRPSNLRALRLDWVDSDSSLASNAAVGRSTLRAGGCHLLDDWRASSFRCGFN